MREQTGTPGDQTRRSGAGPKSSGLAGRALSPRVRRNRLIGLLLLLLLALFVVDKLPGSGHGDNPAASGSHAPTKPPTTPAAQSSRLAPVSGTPLDTDWTGDGQAVTLAFGGDVHFPADSALRARLADDPETALGTGVRQLLAGANLSMVNFESALTDGSCPQPQPKSYVFSAPAAAITAFKSAGITLVTEANNHGEDCGRGGLQMALAIRTESGYNIIGIGQNSSEAFKPYRATIKGQRIAIIAATQVIDSELQQTWSATDSQPGLASAYDVDDLVAAVQAARRTADTLIVYLHWGVELRNCPGPLQQPLAAVLVKAGADVVLGSHAHVLLGGGYLGSAYVDYGLGNFAFYHAPPPTNQSGSLVIKATGRHIDNADWRPAVIENELPVPLTGTAASAAVQSWTAGRNCTGLQAGPGPPLATKQTETANPPSSQLAALRGVGAPG
jgi:poly-gamma-glutamate synthesis protein (capsule biosynthesis protein)